jgi:prepilin-type N-terminal cleavage/methylation domain-containing protein/prepilin-type processing-associated H-X9-DG protein
LTEDSFRPHQTLARDSDNSSVLKITFNLKGRSESDNRHIQTETLKMVETMRKESAMRVSGQQAGGRNFRRFSDGFSLIELLVTISIISLLMGMLFPAINAARESSRQTACASNLRQFGIGMTARAQRHKTLCSGAFDWEHDGCVTEVGWVADLVKEGTPVGKMLCPSNPCKVSRVYNDLLDMNVSSPSDCVDWVGSPSHTEPDGTLVRNPCRTIVELGLAPGSEERRSLIEEQVFNKHFNTNYATSWWLVRTGVTLDDSGNLKSDKAGCQPSLLSRHSTLGPLTQVRADTAKCSSSFIPLLGCSAASKPLTMTIGPYSSGTFTAQSITAGPVTNPGMITPSFAPGTPSGGADGWSVVWKATLQDYRKFGPVHRHTCNVLFADGGVRSIADINGDGMLNNGFHPSSNNGFTDSEIELSHDEVISGWQLR